MGSGEKGDGLEFGEEERRMRMRDYAVEMSRLMGKQLAKGLGGNR